MKIILVIIFAVTIVINWIQFLVYAADTSVNDIRKQSFRQQLLKSNREYLIEQTLPFLKKLNTINEEISSSSSRGKKLVSWLNEGDTKERVIIEAINGLIDFREFHNDKRIDTWTKEDSLPAQFIGPFKIHAELVKSLKQKYSPWRFVTVHWYPNAINLNLHNDPFLKDALELTPAMWNVNDDIIQRYALFSFYRKTQDHEKFNKDFLENETGYKSYWTVNGELIKVSRWVYPSYYEYKYISPGYILKHEPHSLKSFTINHCCSQEIDTLDVFYLKKVELFHDVLNEMEYALEKGKLCDSYWGIYSFVCRTFPCISAFKVKKVHYSNGVTMYRFVDGYDDKPAQRIFDDPTSVVGHAYQFWKSSKGISSNAVINPILLLQFEIESSDPTLNGGFQYIDIKVGFKGYVDFYNELM